MNMILFVMALIENGGTNCITEMVAFNVEMVNFSDILMAIGFTTFKLGLITPIGLMTHSAYIKKWKLNTGVTTILLIILHGIMNIWQMSIIYGAAGILSHHSGVSCSALLPYGNIILFFS